jgi:hypothetical protein
MRLRNRIEAQFGMTNTLGIRTDMEAGLVTIEELYNIFPFENTLTVMYLSGEEVQELMDYVTFRSAERGCQTQAQDSGIYFVMDCAQARRNVSAPSCNLSADCANTDFANLGRPVDPVTNPLTCQNGQCYKHSAHDIAILGQPLVLTDSYKVAVNDYIGAGGSGFEVLRRNTTKFNTGLSLRDALIDYMREAPDHGGPGRTCGSPFLVDPVPAPPRPYATLDKAMTGASCGDASYRPSGCTPTTGRFVNCDDTTDMTKVQYYCIPFDFKLCPDLGKIATIFETKTRTASVADGAGCKVPTSRACEGQLHCCEHNVVGGAQNQVAADFYCVVPYCVDPPDIGRIKRVVE